MLETVNDYLSFLVIVVLLLFGLRIFIGSFFNFRKSSTLRHTYELLAQYEDNEDE